MLNVARLPMHQVGRPDDLTAERRSNCLVPQAYSQDRNFPCKVFDHRNAQSSFLRRTGSRRNQYPIGLQVFDLLTGDLVVPTHLNLSSQLTQVLDEVVSER